MRQAKQYRSVEAFNDDLQQMCDESWYLEKWETVSTHEGLTFTIVAVYIFRG